MAETTNNQKKWFTMPAEQVAKELGVDPVSYTHLTLPTN